MNILQSCLNGLVYGGIYAVAAFGFALVYFTINVFHVAYGAILAAGAMTAVAWTGADRIGGLPVGCLVGALVAIVLSCAVYLLVYRPMSARGASTLSLFVASLGASLVLLAGILFVFGPNPRNFDLDAAMKYHEVATLNISWLGLACIAAGALAFALVHILGTRTLIGQQMRAVASNKQLAELRGISVTKVILVVFALSGIFALVAGVLLGATTSVTPDFGTSITLLASIAVLVGGNGSYLGTYVGAIFIGVVASVSAQFLPGQWSSVMVFGAFIVVVLIRPNGLLAGRTT